MSLRGLALSRATVDRVTMVREDPEWVAKAWADPGTRVLVVSDGRALLGGDGSLVFVSPAQAPAGTRLVLGMENSTAYFGISADLPDISGTTPVSLRQAGALLSDRDAGLMTHAVALANWHDTHTHCPRCGAATVVSPGGHIATCPVDGTQHFPRTDPAVIMLVTDPDDRALLARNAAWPERRMSILAGFVEPGESAELAVVREVAEETGIYVSDVTYLGSQPWPMPRSLMLGFRAAAAAGQTVVADLEEIAEARWFTRAELLAAVQDQEIALPPESSIARRIVESWYGSELPPGASFIR